MSYPRRQSYTYSDHSDDHAALHAPRPAFYGSGHDRGSWSADSADAASDGESSPPVTIARRARGQRRRSSIQDTSNVYAAVEPDTPHTPSGIPNPFASDVDDRDRRDPSPSAGGGWNPASLYDDAAAQIASDPPSARQRNMSASRGAPPSSFAYPFQAYPGNADPLPSRRSSTESLSRGGHAQQGSYNSVPNSPSERDLGRPYAPFMGDGGNGQGSPHGSMYGLPHQRTGSPGPGSSEGHSGLPRVSSTQTFRAPFLSPASRPSSSLWSPPSYNAGYNGGNGVYGPNSPSFSPSASQSMLALPKPKAPLPSTRLSRKLSTSEKPWLKERDARTRISWWLTFGMIVLGIVGSAALCFFGYRGVNVLQGNLCLVMDDDFDSLDTDNNWSYDVELGGFGNGEFQATTDSPSNIFTQNSELYIMPTLTSDTLDGGKDAIFNGGKLSLDNCSTNNKTACAVQSSSKTGTVVNPVLSARINTKGKKSIQFGRVEVRAKLPRGDWLWPAIWMLPEDNVYGAWPLSGEIDIMEARGNGPEYSQQGNNFVRSSLNYGPLESLTHIIFGWWSQKRTSFADAFHVYALEWDSAFMRFYVDNRLNKMLELTTKKSSESFWHRGGFPETAQNGSSKVVVSDIYSQNGGSNAAPFDQSFYLLLDLAAGGTSGWFPDGAGGKPWYDASSSAMFDFAWAQDTWAATWPESQDDRAFRVDYVKMWSLC